MVQGVCGVSGAMPFFKAGGKKAAPLLGPRFKRSSLEGFRKGDASYRSARRSGTSGNGDERK
jgi:hypothetical protein